MLGIMPIFCVGNAFFNPLKIYVKTRVVMSKMKLF